jgi:hypothetical protein
MLDVSDRIEVGWNLEILGFDRGKRRVLHQRTHNIVTNTGRQFIAENLAAAAFSGGGFTRQQNTVVRYVGLGIGGTRQNAPAALQAPLSDAYPGGYGGSNNQTDIDVSVARLERPVRATESAWMKQVGAPASFPSANAVTWVAQFDAVDVNLTPHTVMPISEVGLYSSGADPAQPNGAAGTYPGGSGFLVAYDTFISLPKTGYWSLLVRWTWKF